MNILITFFARPNFGGIINHTESMAMGFKKLGHSVDSIKFKNLGESTYPEIKDKTNDDGWEFSGGLDLWINQGTGWSAMQEINYNKDIFSWKNKVKNYDLIIHQIPVPTCNKKYIGDSGWLELFNHDTRQIVISHNGNAKKSYPHLISICDKISGIICVHESSYKSCEMFPVRRTLIPNPHEIECISSIKDIKDRENSIVSIQTFKRCKRVDKFVRCIPHIDKSIKNIVCGSGIEFHYMNSKAKVKKDYLEKDGSRIWENALNSGMKYMGVVTNTQRDEILSKSKLFLDFSFSKTHNEQGCVFNRTMIEAMKNGCVPVMSDLTIRGSVYFKENENYIKIPFDADPKDQALILNNAMLDEERLIRIQKNNIEIVKQFDNEIISKRIIDFSFGDDGVVGSPTKELLKKAEDKMNHFLKIG